MKRSLLLLALWLTPLMGHAQLGESLGILIKNAPKDLSYANSAVSCQIFQAARESLPLPASLLPSLQHSVVQVLMPTENMPNLQFESAPVSASGFLLEAYGQVWVASAHHVFGRTGNVHKVRLLAPNGEEKEISVEVAVHGTPSYHGIDLALAPIHPEDIPEGAKPLQLATPDLNAPAYSVGYVSGRYTMADMLPVRREIFDVEGGNLFTSYHIEGSTWEQPVSGNGQCGSPIVQQVPGTDEWRVVGLHNGHCLDLDNPSLGRSSGVDLSVAIPKLLDPYFDESLQIPARMLYVRGFPVGMLQPNEVIARVKLLRDGKDVWEKNLAYLPMPYSDAHAELAFEGYDVKKGDKIVFTMLRRQAEKPHRKFRNISFVMP